MTIQVEQSNLRLWSWWVIANILGAGIGWLIAVVLGFMTLGGGLIIAGGIAGIGIGTAQTIFLERYMPERQWKHWLYATTIGATLCWVIFPATQWLVAQLDRTLLYHPMSLIWSFSIGGAIFGVAQWIVLRKNIQHASWWILATCVGWGVAAPVGSLIGDGIVRLFYPRDDPYAGRLIGYPDYILIFVAGTVATAIFASIIGIMLLRLSARRNYADIRI